MTPDLCPKCHAKGVMAPLDGLTCAMSHGKTSEQWAREKNIRALEDEPGFGRQSSSRKMSHKPIAKSAS